MATLKFGGSGSGLINSGAQQPAFTVSATPGTQQQSTQQGLYQGLDEPIKNLAPSTGQQLLSQGLKVAPTIYKAASAVASAGSVAGGIAAMTPLGAAGLAFAMLPITEFLGNLMDSLFGDSDDGPTNPFDVLDNAAKQKNTYEGLMSKVSPSSTRPMGPIAGGGTFESIMTKPYRLMENDSGESAQYSSSWNPVLSEFAKNYTTYLAAQDPMKYSELNKRTGILPDGNDKTLDVTYYDLAARYYPEYVDPKVTAWLRDMQNQGFQITSKANGYIDYFGLPKQFQGQTQPAIATQQQQPAQSGGLTFNTVAPTAQAQPEQAASSGGKLGFGAALPVFSPRARSTNWGGRTANS